MKITIDIPEKNVEQAMTVLMQENDTPIMREIKSFFLQPDARFGITEHDLDIVNESIRNNLYFEFVSSVVYIVLRELYENEDE